MRTADCGPLFYHFSLSDKKHYSFSLVTKTLSEQIFCLFPIFLTPSRIGAYGIGGQKNVLFQWYL